MIDEAPEPVPAEAPPEPVAAPEAALPPEAPVSTPEPAAPEIAPAPLDLGAQQDNLYSAMVESDKTVLRLRGLIATRTNTIREETHQRHLHKVALKSHCIYLKQIATAQIRASIGLKKINGARLPAESLSAYKARMSAARKLHVAQVNAELAKLDNPPRPQ